MTAPPELFPGVEWETIDGVEWFASFGPYRVVFYGTPYENGGHVRHESFTEIFVRLISEKDPEKFVAEVRAMLLQSLRADVERTGHVMIPKGQEPPHFLMECGCTGACKRGECPTATGSKALMAEFKHNGYHVVTREQLEELIKMERRAAREIALGLTQVANEVQDRLDTRKAIGLEEP